MKSGIVSQVVISVITALVLGFLAWLGGVLGTLFSVKASDEFYVINPTADQPVSKDAWAFCALTRVSLSPGGTCRILKKGNQWVWDAAGGGNQQCAATCWK
jgi:hypothetical protein